MSKKSIILCVLLAVILIGGIAVAVGYLYSDRSAGSDAQSQPDMRKAFSDLLAAVPSDAVAVATVTDGGPADVLLPAGIVEPDSLANGKRMVVSFHNSAVLTPLYVTDSGDSTGIALWSTSETVAGSSRRHMEEGRSILDNKGFSGAYQMVQDKNSLFFSNNYASKIVNAYFGKEYSSYAPFLRNLAEWTGMHVKENNEKHLVLQGNAFCGNSAAYFMNVLRGQGASESRIATMLPSTALLAISFQISDFDSYYAAYQKYLDASQKLSAFHSLCGTLKSRTAVAPKDWADKEGIREVAVAAWKTASGSEAKALFVRGSKTKSSSEADSEYQFAGYVTALFGDLFSVADETACIRQDEWIISGTAADMEDLKNAYIEGDLMDDGSAAVLITYARSCFTFEKKKGVRREARNSEAVTAAAIEIPKGPFPVRNSSTGKTCLFYQNDHLSLCLKEESGKGIWGVPFKMPICGSVKEVDYYNNGKIQFLFAAGSGLYLIDRLGRFVSGFPVELGREVLLGPDVYDFSGGQKGYTAIVLHKDNTIGMYNLHGNVPDSWKGIVPEEPVVGMPGLLETGGKKYWAVPTSSGISYYGFWGGERIKDKKTLNAISKIDGVQISK